MAGEKSVPSRLEQHLQRKLHDARWIGGADYPKSGELSIRLKSQGIIHISIGLAKLRVIESVEQFHAEFGIHAFRYRRIFQKRDVPVVETGAGKEPPPRRSQCAQRLRRKQSGVEVWLS